MKLEIYDIAKLKASLVCAAKKDIRAHLIGVFVEVCAEHILLVSANGHMMSVIRSKFVALHEDGTVDTRAVGKSFIIPREAIESFLKICGKHSTARIDFDIRPEGETERIHFIISDSQGHKVEGKEIDGRFPAWRKCIPSIPRDSEKGPSVSYDASCVGDFGKIATILGYKHKGVTLTEYYGNTFSVSIGDEDFFGVMMGMKDAVELDYSWVK
jgi:DNA polymerase-3 subunit beta